MANAAVVTTLTGHAWIRNSDGSRTELHIGSKVPPGSEIITEASGLLQLMVDGSKQPITIGGGRDVAFAGEMSAGVQDVSQAQAQVPTGTDSERLLQALNSGQDLLANLESAGAVGGGAGGGGAGGSSDAGFIVLSRLAEGTAPLGWGYPSSLPTVPELQANPAFEQPVDVPTPVTPAPAAPVSDTPASSALAPVIQPPAIEQPATPAAPTPAPEIAPTVTLTAGSVPTETTSDALTQHGSQFAEGNTNSVTASFAGIFTVQESAGSAPITSTTQSFSLSIGNADTGLTSHGVAVLLSQDANGNLVGKAGDTVVFTITIDGQTGDVTLHQIDTIDHGSATPGSGEGVLESVAAGSVVMHETVTVTDANGNTDTQSAQADISHSFAFADDAPTVTVTAETNTGELSLQTLDAKLADGTAHQNGVADQASADFSGLFHSQFNMGADEGKGSSESLAYSLSVDHPTQSGLSSEGSPITLTLSHNGTEIDGTDGQGHLVFTVTVDAKGEVTLTQFEVIDHVQSAGNDVLATLANAGITLTATGTVTDGDGDTQTASAHVSIGGALSFADDAPVVVPNANTSVSVDYQGHAFTGSLGVNVGADDASFTGSKLGVSFNVENGSAVTANDGSGATLNSNGHTLQWQHVDINGATITVDAQGSGLAAGYFDAHNNWVSVLTVTGDAKSGTYTVEEYAPINVNGASSTTTEQTSTISWTAGAHPGHGDSAIVSDASSQYSLVFTANSGVTFSGTANIGESRSAIENDGSSAPVNISGKGIGASNNWITSSDEVLNVKVEHGTDGNGHSAETNSLTLGLNLHGGGETTVIWYAYEGNTLVATGTANYDAVKGDHTDSLTISTGHATFDNVVLTADDSSAGFRVESSGSAMDVTTTTVTPGTAPSVTLGATVSDDDGDSVSHNVTIDLHGSSISADQLNGEVLQGDGHTATTMTGYNADGSHGAQDSGNVFVSESGHDTMIGNMSGNDTFVLNLGNASAPGGQDVIQHFLGSDGAQHNDVLNLSEVLNVASSDIGTSAISSHLSIADDGSGNAVLSFTPNVSGQPAAPQTVELQGVSVAQLDSAFGVSGADADHGKLINAMIEQGKVQVSSH
jgi:hypothetical protein